LPLPQPATEHRALPHVTLLLGDGNLSPSCISSCVIGVRLSMLATSLCCVHVLVTRPLNTTTFWLSLRIVFSVFPLFIREVFSHSNFVSSAMISLFFFSLLPLTFITSGVRTHVWFRVCDMVSLKFNLPQLDYIAMFSRWKVKMRVIIALIWILNHNDLTFGSGPSCMQFWLRTGLPIDLRDSSLYKSSLQRYRILHKATKIF
jgi:hypothetical protein